MKKIAFKMKEKNLTFEKWLTKALKNPLAHSREYRNFAA